MLGKHFMPSFLRFFASLLVGTLFVYESFAATYPAGGNVDPYLYTQNPMTFVAVYDVLGDTDIQYDNGGIGDLESVELKKTCSVDALPFVLPVLTQEGYTFNGWSVDSGCAGLVECSNYIRSVEVCGDNMKFYANWRRNSFNVVYSSGDDVLGDAPEGPIECAYGADCKAPDNTYTRVGYQFSGWGCQASVGECEKSVYAVGEDISMATDVDAGVITLTALWSACDTMTDSSCGCSVGEYPQQGVCTDCVHSCENDADGFVVGNYNVCQGQTDALCVRMCTTDDVENSVEVEGTVSKGNFVQRASLCAATKCKATHYLDNGQCAICPENASCSGTDSWKCMSGYEKDGNVCVPKDITVTFDTNGGSGGTDSVSITYGELLPDIDVPVHNENYVFDGYWDNADGGVQYYDEKGVLIKKVLVDSDMVLYAHWVERGVCMPGMYYDADSGIFLPCPASVDGQGYYCPGGTGTDCPKIACPSDYPLAVARSTDEGQCYVKSTAKCYCYKNSQENCEEPYNANSCTYKTSRFEGVLYKDNPDTCVADPEDDNIVCQPSVVTCNSGYYFSGDLEYGKCVLCSTLANGEYSISNALIGDLPDSTVGALACFYRTKLACTPPVCPSEGTGTCTYDASSFKSNGAIMRYGTTEPVVSKDVSDYMCPLSKDTPNVAPVWSCEDGYYKNENADIDPTDGSASLPSELCLPRVYSVTLNSNGADVAGTTVIYEKYKTGWFEDENATVAISKIVKPEKKYSTFDGYYTVAVAGLANAKPAIDANGVINLATDSLSDMTLYAWWKPNTYVVAYNANGGVGVMTSEKHTCSTSYNLAANTFEPNGNKEFLGWALSADASAPDFAAGESVSNLTDKDGVVVTLYAVWADCAVCNPGHGANCQLSAPKGVCTYTTECLPHYQDIQNASTPQPVCVATEYNVKFETNGGVFDATANVADKCSIDATKILLPTADQMQREDYKFVGWYNNSNFMGNAITEIEQGACVSDVTLYAKWQLNVLMCQEGLFYDGNEMQQCPKGSYCPGEDKVVIGTVGCAIACPDGYVDGGLGYKSEEQCQINVPQGKYLATAKTKDILTCPVGQYTANARLVSYGQTSDCTGCEAGNYCQDGKKYSCSVQTNAVFVKSNPNSGYIEDCYALTAAGKYIANNQVEVCKAPSYCPGNITVHYNSFGGSLACADLSKDVEWFSDITENSASTPSKCYVMVEEGAYWNGNSAVPCALNTYNMQHKVYYGQVSSCLSCPTGYTSDVGAEECHLFTTPGKYVAVSGGGETNCMPGDYCKGDVKVMYSGTGGNISCKTLGQEYTSAANAGSEDMCYKSCSLTEHATQMEGYDYYGAGKDTCKAVACETGFYVVDGACTIVKYDISYETNGGTIANGFDLVTECEIGSKDIVLPDAKNVTREFHVFDGWYDNPEFNGEAIKSIPAGACVANKMLYAKWLKTMEVTYVATEISAQYANMPNKTICIEGKPCALASMEVAGGDNANNYSFVSWVCTDCNQDYQGQDFYVGQDISELFGMGLSQFVMQPKIAVRISYQCDNGATDGQNPAVLEFEEFELPLSTACVKEGYKIIGWKKIGDDASVHSLGEVVKPVKPTVFVPAWLESGVVTLWAQKRVNDAPSTEVIECDIASETIELPIPSGDIEFGGWYDNLAFTGEAVTSIPAGTCVGNKRLYAKMTPPVYSLDDNGAQTAGVSKLYYTPSAAINGALGYVFFDTADNTWYTDYKQSLAKLPVKQNYSLIGYKQECGAFSCMVIDGVGNIISAPCCGTTVPLVAQWEPEEYNISYENDGGKFVGNVKNHCDIETAKFVLPTLEKSGYTFGGWYDNPQFTGNPVVNVAAGACSKDLAFYAKFTDCPAGYICDPSVDMGQPKSCDVLTNGTHKFAAANSGDVSDCYLLCEAYDVRGGKAVPVSEFEFYPSQCTFEGISNTGNPCEIKDGKCIETKCNYNYEMDDGVCVPCARENAISYKQGDNNCVIESCQTGFHPNGQMCEKDVIACEAPNAVAATQKWDHSKNAFAECVVTECADGFHVEVNTCQADEQTCDVENGIGVRVWNHKAHAWGECVATKCDPGYTNDRSQTNELWKQCGRCNNMYSANGDLAASTYVNGCEIASCMYEGELYTLDNNECLLICDNYSDETGSRRWVASSGRCEHKCAPGYMEW